MREIIQGHQDLLQDQEPGPWMAEQKGEAGIGGTVLRRGGKQAGHRLGGKEVAQLLPGDTSPRDDGTQDAASRRGRPQPYRARSRGRSGVGNGYSFQEIKPLLEGSRRVHRH